jgi:ribonucleoside-diphosphate reductase alpha chain
VLRCSHIPQGQKGWLIVTTQPDQGDQPRPRPHVWYGSTYRTPTPVGTAFVTVNSDAEGNIREVFITVGRAGSDIMADAEALGRPISLAFRIPTSLSSRHVVEVVIDKLAGIGGSSSLGYRSKQVRSLAHDDGLVLAEHSRLAELIVREGLPYQRDEVSDEVTESRPQPRPVRGWTGKFCPVAVR